MARAFYNEIDEKTAKWLVYLQSAGLISEGRIETQSIADLCGADIDGYERAHFFAGIGGWEHALSLVGWTGPVWTGSCPCQPFSVAGKGKGVEDERHLWPEWLRIIQECQPPVVFGEQVASKSGREWLSGVRADLEALGYAVGCADLCAAGAGAPHIRQRLFFVADRMVYPASEQVGHAGQPWGQSDTINCADGKTRRVEPGTFPLAHGVPGRVAQLRGLGNAIVPQIAAKFIRSYMEARENG